MKHLWTLLLVTSCGPYYVGTKPVEPAEELMASIPVVVAVEPGDQPGAPDEAMAAEPEPAQGPAPLVGWDGREVTPDNRPLHGLEDGEDTHGNLLSMYMDSKEEVDQLKLELAAMGDLRVKQDQMLSDRAAEIASRDTMIAALEEQLATESELRRDLEARLVTAQIRRLEAEKQLLLNILGVDPDEAEAPPTAVAEAKP